MKTFGGTYSSDGSQVFFGQSPIAKADPATFEPRGASRPLLAGFSLERGGGWRTPCVRKVVAS